MHFVACLLVGVSRDCFMDYEFFYSRTCERGGR
jgi:hypothetical protein